MEGTMDEVCEVCRYWDGVWEDIGSGLCRRHAPVHMTYKGVSIAKFPSTSCDEWCGDWEGRRKTDILSDRSGV